MLHLDNKAFFILLSPFALFGLVWMTTPALFKAIENNIKPTHDQSSSIILAKGDLYRTIQAHQPNYLSLLQKMVIRDQNRFWIAERIYHPAAIPSVPALLPPPEITLQAPPPLLRFSDGNISAETTSWSVQMVLPIQNMAIINNKIMRVGQRVDGVKLLQVENNRVCIQTTKGEQWVKLFH